MKYNILIAGLVIGLFGCSFQVQLSDGWMVSKGAEQTICFAHKNALSSWKDCSNLSGSDKTNCHVSVLLDNGGRIFADQTRLSVFEHLDNGESKVLVVGGVYDGEEYYCPTSNIRKEK